MIALKQIAQKHTAKVYKNSNTTINDVTETTLTFDRVQWNHGGMWLAAENDRLTCRTPGEYKAVFQSMWGVAGAGLHEISVYKNGSTLLARRTEWRNSQGGVGAGISISTPCVRMAAGDYFQVKVYQKTGAAISTLGYYDYGFRFAAVQLGHGGAGGVALKQLPFHAARVTDSANKSVASGSAAYPTFDTETFDRGNLHRGAATGELYAQADAIFLVCYSGAFAAAVTGYRRLDILKSAGSTLAAIAIHLEPNAGVDSVLSTVVLARIRSDTTQDLITPFYYQTSGSALNFLAISPWSPQFNMSMLAVEPPAFDLLKSLDFGGTDEYVEAASTAAIRPSTAVTLIVWCKPDFSVGGSVPMAKHTNATDREWEILVQTTGQLIWRLWNGANVAADCLTATGVVVTDKWVMIAITYDGSGVTDNDKVDIYLNGVSYALTFAGAAVPATLKANSSPIRFQRSEAGTFFFGQVGMSMIYNQVLTAAEIAILYGDGIPVDPRHYVPGELQALWLMGQGDTFPTILDVVGEHDGTMYSMEAADIVALAPFKMLSNRSIDFDGTDEYGRAAYNAVFNQANKLTVFARVLVDSLTTANTLVDRWSSVNSQKCWSLSQHTTGQFQVLLSDGTTEIQARTNTSFTSLTAWYTVGFVYDSSLTGDARLKIYVNGVSEAWSYVVGSALPAALNADETIDITVARVQHAASSLLDGKISEVAAWAASLTAAEMAVLHNSGIPVDVRKAVIADPFVYWKADNSGNTITYSSQAIADVMGNSNMTLTNTEAADIGGIVP